VAAFAAEHGVTWPNLLVTESPDDFFDGLDMSCRLVPQTWLIDASGTVVERVEAVLDRAGAERLSCLLADLS